jgi:tetratricopeptide (TPR) repeat protein
MWAAGRALRGFSTTERVRLAARLVSLACAAFAWLVQPSSACAQALGPEQQVPPPLTASSAASSESWSRRLARSHFERALTLDQRGEIASALRELTQAIAIDSTLGEAYLRLGALRERMGDAREAELVYSEAVRLGDSRARALLQRSHLFRAAGHSAQALSDLEASAELDANREVLSELTRQYVEAHAWSAALATARRLAFTALESDDRAGLEAARLEMRALRVLAAETDPTTQIVRRHDWVGRALARIAQR